MPTFLAYDVALAINAAVKPIVERLDDPLADQLKRAATSIALNIAEGNRREGKDRKQHFRIAAGSAAECLAALDLAEIWGELAGIDVTSVRAQLDRQLRLLRGLIRA